MKKINKFKKIKGFALIDVILGAALFAIIAAFVVPAYLYGQESAQLDGKRQRAITYAESGLEALRNIRDNNFSELNPGTYGLATTTLGWILSGSSDTDGEFTRKITITQNGNDRVIALAEVTWQQNLQRDGIVSLQTILSNFAKEQIIQGDFSYSINIDSDLGSSYCATVTVSTTSTVPILWNVNVDLSTFPNNGTPYSVTDADWSFSAPILSASSSKNNDKISDGNPGIFSYCANRPVSPIYVVGSTSNPSDGGQINGPIVSTPISLNLLPGDLIVLIASYPDKTTINIQNTGGQSWTAFPQATKAKNLSSRIFYTIFNGSWSGDPSIDIGSGTLALNVVAHAFRNVDQTSPIDVSENSGNFNSPKNPFDVSITGFSTNSFGAMALSFFVTDDDNTWQLQSPDWTNIGLSQYRNSFGQGTSISSAYKTIDNPGSTGDITNRQITQGGDDGIWHKFSIKRQ